jgi:4-aminobutyrate aminotransferase-like enzyme
MNFLTLWDAYHGNTFFSGAACICATLNGGHTNPPADPKNPDRAFWQFGNSINTNFTRVPNPYCYRCPFRQNPENCDLLCAEWVRLTVERGVIGPAAALIVEPVQSGGAQLPLPKKYLERVREICDEYGLLLIYDEVQTYAKSGFFFAAEYYGVLPDIIFSGKGVGGNMPVSVVIASDSLTPFNRGYEELNTQTNNHVSMAASLKAIEIVERDNLLARGAAMGKRFENGFRELQKRYPKIGDIRALGLMIGVELVKDPATKEPLDPAVMNKIRADAEEMGVIFQFCRENVMKIKPAVIISESEVDFALDVFEKVFEKFL